MAKILRTQSSIENLVQDLADLVTQDNLATSERGDLSLLTTFDKSDLVHSINEINAESDTNRDMIDVINVLLGSGDVGGVIEYLSLSTDANTIIGAINEVDTHVNEALKKADNLASLSNFETSRLNLDVYSKSEVEGLIHEAEINLGSNYSVSDEDARDALEDLTIGDNVFITDAGDGKWAIDKVVSLVGGEPNFERIMDEDIYLNSISKESIKATYESNPDTNAYTDDEQTKVGHLTVTSDIDLDKVIQNDELNTSTTLDGAADDDIASSLAIKTYVDTTALLVANDLSEFNGETAKQEAAHINLDVYSRDTIDSKIQNIEFIDPNTGQVIDIGDMVNVVSDMEKAKKNYFFGLEILGPLR